ncbi:MAG: ComF family protein [Candidatus Omnitrophota bacterium]
MGIKDILYPKTCIVCKSHLKGEFAVDNMVCGKCWGKVKINKPPFCHSCGRHLEKKSFAKHLCGACLKKPLHFDRAFSPYVYEGTIENLIHEFKYKNKSHLGKILSKPMINFIKEYSLPIDYIDLILPVPLSKARLREREFNQAHILSAAIAEEFNKPLLDGALERVRHTKTQTELGINQRFDNVRGSFALKNKDIKGKNILLVDDVLTTGATCSEAARTLKESGANIVFALTLAN